MRTDQKSGSRRIAGLVLAGATAVAGLLGFSSAAQAADSSLFVNDDTNKCMTVSGGSQSNNANVVDSTCLGVGWQEWRLQSAGSGYYTIIAAHSNKCLDIHEAGSGNGIDAQQYSCHGNFNQQFQRVRLSNGNYKFIARHSGRCLEVAGNSNDIQQWSCSSSRHQEWTLQ